ncbi:MAG TPA: 4Fe-4S dicluster domain-containing protein, partial [Polyangiaceae bacterium]|nr:4Fe-4S dicluster domain-containing protein [Polyangiaceae bacterium]
MLSALRVKRSQGRQYIIDARRAQPLGFKGLPRIADEPCAEGCSRCRDVCPSAAIALEPVRIDLGKCVFCTECVAVCPVDKLGFSSEPKFAADQRERLIVRAGSAQPPAVEVAAA